jgi:hypothetical protein
VLVLAAVRHGSAAEFESLSPPHLSCPRLRANVCFLTWDVPVYRPTGLACCSRFTGLCTLCVSALFSSLSV